MRKSIYAFALVLVSLALNTAVFAADAAPSGVVNINTASVEQLALLPRIGPKAAQRIVEYRTEHGPFAKIADLQDVKGIGAKTLALLTPHIAVSGETTLTSEIRSPRKPRAQKPASPASR